MVSANHQEGGTLMKLGITSLGELHEMKEETDLLWSNLFEKNLQKKEEENLQLVEKLPKSEGIGRRSTRSRSNRNIKSF